MHTYAGGVRFVQFRFMVSDFGQQQPRLGYAAVLSLVISLLPLMESVRGCLRTTNEGAPYLARFWPDVGRNECSRDGAGCA